MTRTTARAATAAALAALGLPATAAAHSSVFTTIPKKVVPGSNPVAVVDDAKQYVVANHGNTYVVKETNGVSTGGLLNFKVLPSAYRSTIPKAQWFAEGGTGAQPHATCDVPALTDEAAVLAWQEADPFYTYVPFQTDPVGLDDENLAAGWRALVKARTGVDLATVTDLEAACEALPGATASSYVPVDATATTSASFNSGTIKSAKAPLEAQVAALEAGKTTAEGQLAAARGATAAAEARFARALAAGPMGLVLPASATVEALRGAGLPVVGSGPGVRLVSMRVLTGATQAKRLKLRSRVLASSTATTAADGSLTATVRATGAAASGLARATGRVLVTVELRSGDRRSSTVVNLARR